MDHLRRQIRRGGAGLVLNRRRLPFAGISNVAVGVRFVGAAAGLLGFGQFPLSAIDATMLGGALLRVRIVQKNALDVLVVEEPRAVDELVEHPGRQEVVSDVGRVAHDRRGLGIQNMRLEIRMSGGFRASSEVLRILLGRGAAGGDDLLEGSFGGGFLDGGAGHEKVPVCAEFAVVDHFPSRPENIRNAGFLHAKTAVIDLIHVGEKRVAFLAAEGLLEVVAELERVVEFELETNRLVYEQGEGVERNLAADEKFSREVVVLDQEVKFPHGQSLWGYRDAGKRGLLQQKSVLARLPLLAISSKVHALIVRTLREKVATTQS